jgi:RimJ/RimL family protein N-acetyltransferase
VLGLETIVALVLPGNAASIRVLEKLAMVRADDVIYFGESVQRWVASSKPTATDWVRPDW